MKQKETYLYITRCIYIGSWIGYFVFLVASLVEFFFTFQAEKNLYSFYRILTGYALFGLVVGSVFGLSTSLLSIVAKRRISRVRMHCLSLSAALATLFVIYFGSYVHLVPLEGVPYYSAKSIVYTVGVLVCALFLFLALLYLLGRFSGYLVRENMNSPKMGVRFLIAFLFLLAITISAYCLELPRAGNASAGVASSMIPDDAPNVIVVVSDAMRADHLGCYGYKRDTSPGMDNIGRNGVVFKTAYAQGNCTYVSLPTLFMSLYPVSHNVYIKSTALPRGGLTFVEHLKAAGYATAGFGTHPHLWGCSGYRRGFDEFYSGQKDFIRKVSPSRISEILCRMFRASDEDLTAQALSWIQANRQHKFLIYLHYMATHAPYNIPQAYERNYAVEEISDRIDFATSESVISEAQKRNLIDRYDDAIRFIDDQTTQIVGCLSKFGLKENTLLIITADHGEAFGEHGGWQHGPNFYQENIRVPMILMGPGIPSGSTASEELVGLIDVGPTILQASGITPDKNYQGKDLISMVTSQNSSSARTPYREEIFSEGLEQKSRCIITPIWKLIVNESNDDHNPGGGVELYNLKQDPKEQHNVLDVYPKIARELHERMELKLQEFRKHSLATTEFTIDAETARKLRALGYLQ